MSFKKLCKFILIAGGILAIASCKDEEETSVSPSLEGYITFNAEPFVNPGTVVKMTPKGAKHPEDKGIGYYWRVSPGMDKADTTRLENGLSPEGEESDGSFSYKFPDSLATYTVSCGAFAKGYSGISGSTYVTVVKSGAKGSLTDTGIMPLDPNKVNVDGIDYYYVSHNGLDWMRNNLANPAFGAPYANAEAVSDILGRYYSHEEARNACPPGGWRLPTDQEWRELAASVSGGSPAQEFSTIGGIAADFMANAQFNLRTMWEYWPAVGEITNKSGLSMIPSGYANLGKLVDGAYPMAAFTGIYRYAAFWTADEVADEEGMAYYRYLICDQPGMYISKGDTKSFGASVRCVRESL